MRPLRDRLSDMAEAIADIESYVGEPPSVRAALAAMDDRRTLRAIKNALLEIGECVKVLPAELRARHPSIDWRGAAALRDIVAHHYFGLNRMRIARTIVDDLPTLRDAVAAERVRLASGA